MKRIIIIGATSGIGLEVAKIYHRQGWKVGVAGRRAERLEKLKAIDPAMIEAQQIDITADDAPDSLHRLIDKLGGMDLFFISSGVGKQNLLLDPSIEFNTIETNVKGFTQMVLTAYHYFMEQGKGHIAVISSIAGTKGMGAAPSYSATKRFQNTYIEALTQMSHLRKSPVSFTDIRPGFVHTELLDDGKQYPVQLSAEKVAIQIKHALDRKKNYITIDWRYRLLVFFWRMIPRRIWVLLPIHN